MCVWLTFVKRDLAFNSFFYGRKSSYQFLQIMLLYIGFAKAFYAFTGLPFNTLRRRDTKWLPVTVIIIG